MKKEKKKRKTEEVLQFQVGAMDKFLCNTSNVDKEIYEKVQDEKDINEEWENLVNKEDLDDCEQEILKDVENRNEQHDNLELIKLYLRSIISQEILNGLTILSIEKHMLEQIDFNNLIIDFLSKNACRINLQ